MTDINQYFSSEPRVNPDSVVTPVVVSKKKRKRENDDGGLSDLKQKARLYCSCPQQWKSVSKYGLKRMEEFVQEKEFERQQQLFDNIFGFAHQFLALALDTVTKSNGFVQTEIENDLSLRQAIEAEGARFVQFLNNRWKLLALTSVDVFNGKRKQLLAEPPAEPEIVEIHGGCEEGQPIMDEQIVPVDPNPNTDTFESNQTAEEI